MVIYLVILSAILILFNIKSLNKEKQNKGFSYILKNEEEIVTNTNVEIIKLRKDLSETIVELQREIVDLKEEINYLKYKITDEKIQHNSTSVNTLVSDKYVKSSEQERESYNNIKKNEELNLNNDIKTENKTSSKILEIKSLTNKGLSNDEICKKLNLGKGELLLIKDLYN